MNFSLLIFARTITDKILVNCILLFCKKNKIQTRSEKYKYIGILKVYVFFIKEIQMLKHNN